MSNDTSMSVSPTGYMEVYYRKAPRSKRINTRKQIHREDYEKVMGPVPISEFNTPVELLRYMTSDSRASRPPKEGDVLVMRVKTDESGWLPEVTCLVVDVTGDRMAHLHTRKTRIMWGDRKDRNFKLGLLTDNLKFDE